MKVVGLTEKRLHPTRLSRIGVSAGQTTWRAIVENSASPEDVLNPVFWGLVATQFAGSGILPHIEIIPDDQSWLLQAVIVDHGKTHASIKKITFTELVEGSTALNKEQQEVDNDGFVVRYAGPHELYQVLDDKGNVIRTQFKKKKEAMQFLEDHKRVIG